MKKAHKLLILLLILAASIGLGITYSEARVCFVVGGCDNEDGTKNKPKPRVMDCRALGFKYLADGIEMDKTEVGRAKYVGKGEPCTSGNKTYFKQKVCKSKYAYVNESSVQAAIDAAAAKEAAKAVIDSATPARRRVGVNDLPKQKRSFSETLAEGETNVIELIKQALKTGYHRADVSLCGANTTPSTDVCVDRYGLNSGSVESVTKHTQCLCDPKYKYFAENIRTGFRIDYEKSTSCATSGVDSNDGKLRYDVVKCSGDYEAGGYWKETCGTKEHAVRSDTWGDLTCNLCTTGGDEPGDPDKPSSPCSGQNLYDSPTACYEGNGAGDARSYTCRIIRIGDATCYERSYRSCAELSAMEYYGADGGYYGYYGSGHASFIQYYDTLGECTNGMSSNEVCSSRTLWSDTYYGAFDGKVCYFREQRALTRTCADYGKYDSYSACTDTKRIVNKVKIDREKLLDRLSKEDLIKPYDKSELFDKLGKTDLFKRFDTNLLIDRLNKEDIIKPFDKTDLIGKLGKDTLVARLDTATLAARIDKTDLTKAFTKDELIAPFAKDELVARFDTTDLTTRAAANIPTARRAAAMRGTNTAALSTTERTAMIADLNKNELFASYSVAEVADRLDKNTLIDRLGKDAVVTRVDTTAVLNRFDKAELAQPFNKTELFDKLGKDTLVTHLEKGDLLTRFNKEDLIKPFVKDELINRLNKEDLLNRLEKNGLIKVMEEEVVTEDSHSCIVTMIDGLTCYDRVQVDCTTFSGPELYYNPYYYGPARASIRYFNSFTECMAANNSGKPCASKVMSGKTCYYREEPVANKSLMGRVSDLFSGIANKFTKTFDRTETKQVEIAPVATTRFDGIADRNTNAINKVFDTDTAKSVGGVSSQRFDGIATAREGVAAQRAGELAATGKAMLK